MMVQDSGPVVRCGTYCSVQICCKTSTSKILCTSTSTSGFLPPTMSYVTYDVVRRQTRHRRSDVRHRMSHRTYDIARTIFKLWTYDIVRTMSYVLFTSYVHVRHRMLDVRHRVYTSYTTSYVKLNMRHRTCTTYDIVCLYRIRCRTCNSRRTMSYVNIRYRI